MTFPLVHILLGLALAGSARVRLESSPAATREELALALGVAESHGWDARVERRQDGGEELYVLVIQGFEDQATAHRAAALMAEQASVGFAVTLKGRGQKSADAGPEPQPDAKEPTFGAPDALERASEALGGPDAGLALLSSQPRVVFRYDRMVLVEGQRSLSRQEWVQQGQDLRLRAEVLEGPGTSSTTLVVGGQAWVSAAGRSEPRDVARTREVLASWSPEQLLAYPLRFAELVATDPGWQALELVGEEDCPSGRCWVLEGASAAGALRLHLDTRTGHPAQLSLGEGEGALTYTFEDWKKLEVGVVVPQKIELRRGSELIESLRVQELSAPKALPTDTFTPPAAP